MNNKTIASLSAGLGLTILSAERAEAAVIYSGPQNIIVNETAFPGLPIDIDGDLTIDFTAYDQTPGTGQVFAAYPTFTGPNDVVGVPNTLYSLPAGTSIGPGSPFVGPNGGSNGYFGFLSGPGLAGFKFVTASSMHYGWVRLATSPTNFTVVDWAFESVPNAPILAGATAATPEPSTMALLALGAAGVTALRRRKKTV
jgi:hypothetical protein